MLLCLPAHRVRADHSDRNARMKKMRDLRNSFGGGDGDGDGGGCLRMQVSSGVKVISLSSIGLIIVIPIRAAEWISVAGIKRDRELESSSSTQGLWRLMQTSGSSSAQWLSASLSAWNTNHLHVSANDSVDAVGLPTCLCSSTINCVRLTDSSERSRHIQSY